MGVSGGDKVLVKRLELQGFKSFAERVTLEFGPGVTGIVGVNGAGKSNITDAIRWVLGEQNPRLLRCSRMDDVIFNGSSTRRALGFAEVVLVLDNEDGRLGVEYSEVSLTRRLFRSGESEYLLNGSPSRLKDITELLSGTGIGKEGYSIVGQGRIDELLLAAPEARRALFDEACGIGLHRSRKKDALSRLDDVAGRLERVSDVVRELETQLVPLDEQARVARTFVTYRDELERLELWLEGREVARLRSRANSARQRLGEIRERASALRSGRERLESELKTLRTAYAELGEMIEQQQHESAASAEARRELLGRVRGLEDRAAERRRQADLVREESGRVARRTAGLRTRLGEVKAGKEARAEELAEVSAELAHVEKECAEASGEMTGLNSALEEAKGELLEVLGLATKARFEMSTAEGEAGRLRAEAARIAREENEAGDELADLAREVASLEESLARITPEAQRCAESLRELEERETALGRTLGELGRRIEEERAAVSELEVEKASLEAALAAGSDWSQAALAAVAAAAETGREGGGLLGVLGEELEVPADLRPALQVALGRYVDALVVETEADLRRFMNHFRSEGFGPAVIVPVDLVARHLDRHGPAAGDVSRASLAGRVSCRPELEPVVRYLLGRIALAATFEEALEVVAGPAAPRAVTPDGVLVRTGGAVSFRGRAARRSPEGPSSLERMGRLRRVRKDLASRKENLALLSKERATADADLGKVRDERSRLASKHQDLALEKATLSDRLEEKKARRKTLTDRLETRKVELPDIGQRSLALEAEARGLKEKLGELARREEALRADIAHREKLVKETGARLDEARQRAGALRVEVATLKEQERSAAGEIVRLTEDLVGLDEESEHLTDRLTRLEEERKKALAELEPLRRKLAAAGTAPVRSEDLDQWRRRREEITSRLTGLEDELREVNSSLEELAQRERRDETRLARLEAEEEMAVRRLVRDWGPDWETKVAGARPGADGPAEEDVPARVAELRERMKDLGVVNIGAIEEHRRLTERMEFLREQAVDLVEARESLLRLIREMDETMARRFEEGFLAVRRHFREWVPQLYGGGRGDLVLTDRENMLESGVEILVEPPSKKLQTLALLSAGERALAALALVLAFLEVRPSPFVVLDEIDAPLDDANVGRFGTAVADLAGRGETQFILVTHNKATMEVAESLYGTAMGDDGVSRLVSVKLEDRKELQRELERGEEASRRSRKEAG